MAAGTMIASFVDLQVALKAKHGPFPPGMRTLNRPRGERGVLDNASEGCIRVRRANARRPAEQRRSAKPGRFAPPEALRRGLRLTQRVPRAPAARHHRPLKAPAGDSAEHDLEAARFAIVAERHSQRTGLQPGVPSRAADAIPRDTPLGLATAIS